MAFSAANAAGAYWATGDTVTTVIDEIAGTCWVTGATLYFGGSAGSECNGVIHSVEVKR